METRVLDTWAHEQDIRRALGRPGGRNGVGEATTLDRCARSMPFVVGKRVAPPDGTSVLFAVIGVMGKKVGIHVDGGRASLVPLRPDRGAHGHPHHGSGGVLATRVRQGGAGACPGHRRGADRGRHRPRSPGARVDGVHDLTRPGDSPGPTRGPRPDVDKSRSIPVRKVHRPRAGTLGNSYASHSRARRGQQSPFVRRDRGSGDRRGSRPGHASALPRGPGARVPSRQGPASGHRGPDGRSRRRARRSAPGGPAHLLRPGGHRHRRRSHRPAGDRHHLGERLGRRSRSTPW